MTWTDLTVASAFVAGTVVGGFAVLWVTRIVFERYRP